MWRIFQLNKYLSKDGHVWNKFGSGNRDSLSQAGKDLKAKGKLNGNASPKTNGSSLGPTPIPSRMASPAPSVASTSSESEADGGAIGRETRRRLVEWWSKEYCASRMNLCVIGKGTISQLDIYRALTSMTGYIRIFRRVGRLSFHLIFADTEPRTRSPPNDQRPSVWTKRD
jgi:insulysin